MISHGWTVIPIIVLFLIVLIGIKYANKKLDKLLKQQVEAKKPNSIREHTYDGYIGKCPDCGRVVRFAQRHCHHCLRLLDWSDVLNLSYEEEKHPNIQKVKKGLECHAKGNVCMNHCPYCDGTGSDESCTRELAKDALELLKAQKDEVNNE